jgi:hypothetical protein
VQEDTLTETRSHEFVHGHFGDNDKTRLHSEALYAFAAGHDIPYYEASA